MAITANVTGGPVQLTGNPVWVHCTGGAAPEGALEYKILLKILSTDAQLMGAPFVDAIAPDGAGEAWFNVSGYVDQPVGALFQYPPSGVLTAYPNQAFNVQVVPGETWVDANGDLQEVWHAPSGEFQLLKGGVSQRQIALWEAAGTSFYQVYLQGRKWLTHRPWGDYVHPHQSVKLWFMSIADVQATFAVKGYFDDGSFESFTQGVTLLADSLCEFNCNPFHHNINPEQTGRRMTHYDVWLESEGAALSDVRRFTITWRYCERPFYLLFANSIGGVDDVYLGGYALEKFDVQGDVVYKPARRGDSVYDPTLVVPNRSGRNAFEISTGYKTPSQMRHLRDLMVSRQVWLLYPNQAVTSWMVIPVVVENTRETLVDHMQDLHAMTLELKEAHNNRFSFDNRLY